MAVNIMSENETLPVKHKSSKNMIPLFVSEKRSDVFSVTDIQRIINPELQDVKTFVIPLKSKTGSQ